MGRTLSRFGRSALLLATILSASRLPAAVVCGQDLSEDTVLTEDLLCPENGLALIADGITLDCAGHSIAGSGVGVGIRVDGTRSVTVRHCTVASFRNGIQADAAMAPTLSNNRISDNAYGIHATDSTDVRIEGTVLNRQLMHVWLRRCPDAAIVGNTVESARPRGSAFAIYESPRVLLAENRSRDTLGVYLWNGCDDAVAEGNVFEGSGTIQLFSAVRSRVQRNRLGPPPPGSRFTHGIALFAVTESTVQENRIEGGGTWGIFLLSEPDVTHPGPAGSDRNVIASNAIADMDFGVLIFGGSENRVTENRIQRAGFGLAIFPNEYPDPALTARSDDNLVDGNVIEDGQFGIEIANASRNRFLRNEIRNQGVGIVDLRWTNTPLDPNRYEDNLLSDSLLFGLVAWGASPEILRNGFRRNGMPAKDLPDDLAPVSELFGEIRGAIAFLPFNGDESWENFDDGLPSNDIVAAPTIGGPGRENVFEDSRLVDIYALDTRALNAASLAEDNRFDGGEAERVRQDWLGLVRVEDDTGMPVSGAQVEVRDARGRKVAGLVTDGSGFPVGFDPDRPLGLPSGLGHVSGIWPRFTEYSVDSKGHRRAATPHRVAAEVDCTHARTRYTWDGLANDPDGFRIEGGRYQTVRVRTRAYPWFAQGTGTGSRCLHHPPKTLGTPVDSREPGRVGEAQAAE